MVSLSKKSLLFFLLFNIICITSPMKILRRIGSSSSKSSKSDAEEGPIDPKERCLWVLKNTFNEDSGKDNFLFALLHLTEDSFENDEQGLAKRYFEDMFDTLNKIASDLPDLRTPQDYCNQFFGYPDTTEACILVIEANTGCKADLEGAKCIKYIYRSWKENNGALPGTEDLTSYHLIRVLRRKYGHRFPDDLPNDKFMDAIRRERYSGGIHYELIYPEDYQGNNYIHGAKLLDEYDRRMSLPEYFYLGKSYWTPYDKYYATYLRDAMHNFGGSAFSDRSDICDSYLSEQQIPLTINEQMDPHNSDSDDSYS